MRSDVLAGDIGDEFLIAIRILIENEANFSSLASVTEALSTQEHTEFERHIKARQLVGFVQLSARQIMDAEAAFLDDRENLLDPDLARVIDFECATRPKPAKNYGENDAIEKRLIGAIERAIYKNADLVIFEPITSPSAWHRNHEPPSVSLIMRRKSALSSG